MVSKAEFKNRTDAPAQRFVDPPQRWVLVREIFGIALIFCSLFCLLSLIAARKDTLWLGQAGQWLADNLDFVLGRYVCFVLPALLAVSAYHALLGHRLSSVCSRSWLRGLGGLLILISTCALLASSSLLVAGHCAQRAQALGGLVGNFLIDAQGCNLAGRMGAVGSCLLFGALALIGLVLFTETLVREFWRLGWSGLRQAVLGIFSLRFAQWMGRLMPAFAWRPMVAFVQATANLHPIERFQHFIGQVSFHRPQNGRVMSQRPIIELRPLDAPHGHPEQEPVAYRSSSVFRAQPVAAPSAPAAARVSAAPAASVVPSPAASRLQEYHDLDDDEREEVAMEREPQSVSEGLAQRVEKLSPVQPSLDLFPAEFQLPSLDLLLDPPDTIYTMADEEKLQLSERIEQTLAQFKIEVKVVEVVQGPVITRFALKVAPGVRVSKILALDSELAMALRAPHVRILAPIPGQAAVGIEVPNKRANPVMLRELLESAEFQQSKSPLTFALGKNIAGDAAICDLAKMPHLLIAGATGSGKSVCLNVIIASLLYRNKPDQVKFVMVDPKRVELSIYQAIPHLIAPVVSETKKAAAALAWCVEQMEKRYEILSSVGVRNLDGYNSLLNQRTPSKKLVGRGDLKPLPHIVIIIDELADLMMVAKNEVEEYIIRLAQMARAVGMHLILATQRPSVNVITGIIKANFPSRIAFQVSSKVDSRTILDINGAEALLGKGDMLYSPGGAKPFRIQGAFVSDAEVERLADYIREQEKARYEKEDFEDRPTQAERAKAQLRLDAERDEDPLGDSLAAAGVALRSDGLPARGRAGDAPLTPSDMNSMPDEVLYEMALKLILEARKASVSYIQRRMKIGYARAGRLMDMMEENGIVGPYQGSKPRDLLVDPLEYLSNNDADNGEDGEE